MVAMRTPMNASTTTVKKAASAGVKFTAARRATRRDPRAAGSAARGGRVGLNLETHDRVPLDQSDRT